jgi:thiol-disulfide isomerase/thioredoxin
MPQPRFLLAFALAALLLAGPASAQELLATGAEIPLAARSMQNAGGTATSFSQQLGSRGLAVVFWSNTCPWVRRYEDRMLDLAREFGQSGVGFIVVNPNDPAGSPGDAFEAMQQRVGEASYPFPYVVDEGSQAARAFGATRTPQVFLFDGAGRLVYEGTVDDSPSDAGRAQERYLRDALTQLGAGQSVSGQRTRAFGCTIKFPN